MYGMNATDIVQRWYFRFITIITVSFVSSP